MGISITKSCLINKNIVCKWKIDININKNEAIFYHAIKNVNIKIQTRIKVYFNLILINKELYFILTPKKKI